VKKFLLRLTVRALIVYGAVLVVYFGAIELRDPRLFSWGSLFFSSADSISVRNLARSGGASSAKEVDDPKGEGAKSQESDANGGALRIQPEPVPDLPAQTQPLPLVDPRDPAAQNDLQSAAGEEDLPGEALVYDQFQDEFADDEAFDGLHAFPQGSTALNGTALGEARVILEADGNLLRHEAEGDIFALLSPLGSRLKTVIGTADYFVSNTYDANLRIVSRTVWQKNEKPSAEAVRFFSYEYADSESKKAQSREVRFVADKTREITEYAFDGLPLRVALFREGSASDVISQTEYVYDAERRVAEKTTRSVQEGETLLEKIIYEYTGKASKPNAYTYHNGSLIKSVVYDSNSAYTELRILEKDYSVITRYESDRLVSERYMFKNTEIRRKVY
jgi:hypothetical protein